MIIINTLQISNDRKNISVDIETTIGQTFTNVKLWTEETYKDYTKAIDLSNKLASIDNTESFTITNTDLNINEYDGLYFIEFTDSESNLKISNASELTTYKKCLLDNTIELLNSDIDMLKGEGCTDGDFNKLVNVDVLLNALQSALLSGYYGEAIDINNTLKKFCKTCSDCPTLESILSIGTLNNTLIII